MSLNLKRSIFWDVDYDKLDYEKNSRFIIGRVLMRGDVDDWLSIRDYYGLDKIKKEVLQIRYLDKLTLNFCSVIFKVKKEEFRCYNTEPSIRKLWDY